MTDFQGRNGTRQHFSHFRHEVKRLLAKRGRAQDCSEGCLHGDYPYNSVAGVVGLEPPTHGLYAAT